ncbi:GntR family transcriptional regulator [Saccharopolyspora mangrovi]|uniref:GntR family transcriptional regulator n=1 Tax=Saccharopolyspora mangrovi TaxID=3082379 RepID=A0ABU6A7G2_9PSEU|nr:GntR family transcriptional regulator [Saccharopolyspora sp. S2-29]MEB3367430.1 GntR family transcriptional regulator [Saccharopolyspora sp. S2-29]
MAKYRQVADQLKADIASGEYGPGAQLPTEPELGERFGVSRTTVREAIGTLSDEGLVTIEHGRGVFVTPPKVVKRLDSRDRLSRARRQENKGAFLAEADKQGFTPSSSVRIAFEPAQDFGEVLGIDPEDEVCVRDRVQRADGKPVQLAVSRLPREITRGTVLEEVTTGPGGAYARIEEMGYELTHFEEIVGGGMATAAERAMLGEQVRAVLRVRRIAYAGEKAVEVNDMVMPADQYELRYSFPAD